MGLTGDDVSLKGKLEANGGYAVYFIGEEIAGKVGEVRVQGSDAGFWGLKYQHLDSFCSKV